MELGDRLPELKIKMKSHSEERLKLLKFHRVSEAPELFYMKFPLVKGASGNTILSGKVIVSSIDGEVKCYLYGQTGDLYPAFYNKNHNTDSYIYKINKLFLEKIKEYGIEEQKEKKYENDKRKHKGLYGEARQ